MANKNHKSKHGMIILVITGFLIISLGTFVSALSIGAIEKIVEVYPGQVVDRIISIQNLLDGSGDLTMEGSFEKGDIIDFLEDRASTCYYTSPCVNFDVPAGQITGIPVRITVPENAPIGAEYPTLVMFRTIAGGPEGGTVSFSQDVGREFTILVVEKPAEPVAPVIEPVEERAAAGNVWTWVLVIVIVLIIIAWLVMRKKK